MMPSCDSCNQEPELRVTPSSFTIDPLDDQASVTVKNVGEADLDWSATSETDWIVQVFPGAGKLASGESEDVALTFDPATMAFGETTGEVRFSANGRIPTWSVAVKSAVSCPGSVATPDSGAVWEEGESREITWQANGAGLVQIDLVGATESRLIVDDELNDGSYTWIVDGAGLADDLCADGLRVRVAAEGRQECGQLSDPFCIRSTTCTSPPQAACSPSPGDLATGIPPQADLSWSCGDSPCNRPILYDVYFGTNPNPGAAELVGTTAAKSWNLPLLDPSAQYYWKIVSQDANGIATSPVWEFSTEGAPCTTPPDAACSPAPADGSTDLSVETDLAWSCGDSPCALGVTYRVYFGTNPVLGPGQLVGSSSSKSWDLLTLVHDTHYYWRIDVEDANGTTTGTVWDFTTDVAPCVAPPAAACTPVPADGGTDISFGADLAWSCGDSQCALAVTYHVYFGTNPTPGPSELVGSGPSKSWALGSLTPETHYYWRIDAEDANGTTVGTVWDFTTDAAPCTAPPVAACTPVPADDATGMSFDADLAWSCGDSQCALAVTYHVYFGTDATPDAGELVGSGPNKSWVLGSLIPQTHYYWRIDAEDANGTTVGTVWDFTTGVEPCTAPPTAACSPVPADGATDMSFDADLAWSCGDSQCALAVTYQVYFGTDATPDAGELVGSGPNKTWVLGSLTPETHYYWRIDTEDANGTTVGTVWDFTTGVEECTAPPTAACSPAPADEETSVSVDANLAWSCGSSPCALSITYWVYLGKSPGSEELLGTTSSPSWDLARLESETHYYWRIDTVDENGTTAGPVWDFTTGTAPCTSLPTAACTPAPATGGSDVAIDTDLAWSCGDSQCSLPVTYRVFFGTSPALGPGDMAGSSSSKSWDLLPLAYATHYYWRIDTEDANGTTVGTVWDFTTAAAPCVAPPTAACAPAPATGGTDLRIDTDLAWSCGDTQCALPVTYHVYFGTNPIPGPGELVGSSSSKSWDLLPLAYGTQYYWRIDAEDANGTTPGPVWDFTTAAAPCVSSPTAACAPAPATGGTDLAIDTDLAWSCGDTQCALPVTYRVYFGTNPDPGAGELVGSTDTKGWDLPVLAHEMHYYWRIDSEDANGTTPGPVWGFATVAAAPCVAQPTQACAPGPGNGGTDVAVDADLAWSCGDSQCSLPVTYRVYLGTSPSPGTTELLGSTDAKTWDLPTLVNETHYYWRIEAEDANGTTSSPVWDFTTAAAQCTDPPTPPCDPSPADGEQNVPENANLAWGCGQAQCLGVVTYHIYFGQDETPDDNEYRGSTIFQFANLPNLDEEETYYWRIDVQDLNGTTVGPVWEFETEDDGSEPIQQSDSR